MSTARHLSLGAEGERLARDFLLKRGYRIVGQNLRLGGVEIDIIALDKKTAVLVEVKTRRSSEFGRPEEAVTQQKLSRLSAAAAVYARSHPEVKKIRLDVIAIVLADYPAKTRLRHYRGVGEDASLVNFD